MLPRCIQFTMKRGSSFLLPLLGIMVHTLDGEVMCDRGCDYQAQSSIHTPKST